MLTTDLQRWKTISGQTWLETSTRNFSCSVFIHFTPLLKTSSYVSNFFSDYCIETPVIQAFWHITKSIIWNAMNCTCFASQHVMFVCHCHNAALKWTQPLSATNETPSQRRNEVLFCVWTKAAIKPRLLVFKRDSNDGVPHCPQIKCDLTGFTLAARWEIAPSSYEHFLLKVVGKYWIMWIIMKRAVELELICCCFMGFKMSFQCILVALSNSASVCESKSTIYTYSIH